MRIIENIDRGLWHEVAANCPYATFFHTPQWADLMAGTLSYVDMTKGFKFDDGTIAILPFMRSKAVLSRGFFYDYVSGPPYTYGGPISERPISQENYDEIIDYVTAKFKRPYRILIRGNPYHHNISTDYLDKLADVSHVFDLSRCQNEEDIYRYYQKRYRSYIRKANRSDLLGFSEARTIREYEKLYEIYQKSKKYWETDLTHYPLRLFRNLYRMRSENIKLWTVSYDGRMIGGDVTLYWNDKCFMWLSYHDRQYSKQHARRYMLHQVFGDCRNRGINFYDFLQSAGIKSQENFKVSMGGSAYPHTALLKESIFLKYAKQLKNVFKFKNNPKKSLTRIHKNH